ncbi:MAG: DUF5337 family protein [Pseudomonadota bacterium]
MTRDEEARRQTGRLAAIVVAAAFGLWLLGSWLGGALGLPTRFAFLLDFLALAAFAWAAIVLVRLWRAGRAEGPGS